MNKKLILTGLSLVALQVSSALATSADDEHALKEYRIETNDCLGCGAVEIKSQIELKNYMTQMNALLSERTSGTSSITTTTSVSTITVDPQVVFLDFDAGGQSDFPVCNTDGTVFGVFQDYVYSQAERDAIQALIASDYEQFNYTLTQKAPTQGEYTTIYMGQNDAPLDCSEGSNITVTATGGVSILFGRAEAIDFLNKNKNDNAFADASFWTFLVQLGGTSLFESFSGISVTDFDGDLSAALSYAVVNQSANTGAHEAGHIQGLRHQNSFGAPGDGIPDTGAISPFAFVPVFDGPSNATESILHTMASGASVGLGLTGSTKSDRFFSERSAIRLAINENGLLKTESEIEAQDINRINMRALDVPNTILVGKNSTAEELEAEALVVKGNLDIVGEQDSYYFRGKAGEYFNAELISATVEGLSFVEGILGQVSIYLINADETETLVSTNSRSFESLFDTEIFDAELPKTGLYRVEISAPDIVFSDFDGDGEYDALPLTEVGGGDLLYGQYSVQMYTSGKALDSDADTRDSDAALAFLENYNLVVFEDLDASVNIAGKAFIGGDLIGPSSTFASQLTQQQGEDYLVVAGSITGNAKNINNGGNVRFGGELNANVNLNGGGDLVYDPTISTVAAENVVRSLSADLAELTVNSTAYLPTSKPGAAKLVANANTDGVAVFTIEDGNALLSNSLVQQIELEANGASTIVINLRGSDIVFDSGNLVGELNSGNTAASIIWNFPDATKLTIQRSIAGIILAPEAKLTNQSNITGSVVVAEILAAGSILNNGYVENGLLNSLPE
jgi:choice-of-anchor A domain-containing protein